MRIFAIIVVLLFGVGYLAYGWVTNAVFEGNVKSCVEKAKQNVLFRGDVNELCNCTMEFTKEQLSFDKSDPEFKKEFGVRMMGCSKIHVSKYGTDQCDKMKVDIKSTTGQNLDCTCMNQKLLNVFMQQWAETGGVQPEKMTKMSALNMVSGCLK